MDELLKNTDLEKVAKEGALIYEEIKSNYKPEDKGKFLAIDIDSKSAYMADTSAEAMVAARAARPNRVFYVMRIGFDAAETMAHFSAVK